jgi:hypothetical protein
VTGTCRTRSQIGDVQTAERHESHLEFVPS